MKTKFVKRALLVLLPLLGAFSLLTSCGSDDDEPQPEWSFPYGEWMPAGQIYYRTIDGDSVFDYSSAYLPNDMRLIFSPSGNVDIYKINERAELPWKNGSYKYEVKKGKEENLILYFHGKEGCFWHNTEEDALYYNINDTLISKQREFEWSRTVILRTLVFKRPVEKGSLPIQKQDKNVDLMPVSEMPEWMQKEVSGWQGKWGLYYQFKYKGNIYYQRWNTGTMQASCFLENGDYVDENNSEFNFNVDLYHLYWYTTDWKKVYTPYPTN